MKRAALVVPLLLVTMYSSKAKAPAPAYAMYPRAGVSAWIEETMVEEPYQNKTIEAAALPEVSLSEIEEEDIESEYELLACLVYAEAGNQSDYGKELVADVVLNRVDSPSFPDTITDVIYQKYQFSSVWDGGLDKAFERVDDSCYMAVKRARSRRLDSKILFFTAYEYNKYGTPAYKVGDHCFSWEKK